jgi:hypothetical protein
MTLQEWMIWTKQDREAAIKLFLNREFVEGGMSDWRKILVAYIRHRKQVESGNTGAEIQDDLTVDERESLAAAIREAEGKQ